MKKLLLLVFLTVPVILYSQKFENLALTPPMGWNSWNTFGVEIDEQLIMETVDILVESGMKEAGYEYIVIDDGWEALKRDSLGNLVPDPQKFPSGMKAVGDYIHSKGLKFGIHNCAGTLTCNGFPGGRGHEFQDARTYASWGVDFLKYDWCYNGTANSQETFKTMSDALYAAGRPVVFSLCEWGETKPWEWAENIGHLWRTTHDIKDCYNCQNINNIGWKYILDIQVGLEKYAGPGHWNDPDMLEVGNKGLSLAESRAHFSLWCMLAAPLMAGNDLRKMTPEILNILTNKEVIAIDQDPLGKQGYRLIKHISKEIWVKELSNGDWAICFLNTGDEPLKLSMNWDHFGILNGEYKVRNIWEKENLGTTKQLFNSEIAPHDVALLRFSKL